MTTTKPGRNWLGAGITVVLMILLSAGTILISYGDELFPKAAKQPPPQDAWALVERHLECAEQEAQQALDKHLASIQAFLGERKAGSRAFAERLTSLKGQWEIVKAQIKNDQEYRGFLSEAFAEHLFKGEELQEVVSAAITGYLTELDGIEARLLVRLKADLSEEEWARRKEAFQSDEFFARHFQDLTQQVSHDLTADLHVTAGRELALWEATPLATALTVQLGESVAERLGYSSGLLGAGVATSWRTLGVGLVVAIVLNAVINEIIDAAGYNAGERVAKEVMNTLEKLGVTITDGDPEARSTLSQLKTMATDDPEPSVREACRDAAQRIEAGGQLNGLRGELTRVSAERAALRKEALRRLLQKETTP